jgi:hypothetical protein
MTFRYIVAFVLATILLTLTAFLWVGSWLLDSGGSEPSLRSVALMLLSSMTFFSGLGAAAIASTLRPFTPFGK